MKVKCSAFVFALGAPADEGSRPLFRRDQLHQSADRKQDVLNAVWLGRQVSMSKLKESAGLRKSLRDSVWLWSQCWSPKIQNDRIPPSNPALDRSQTLGICS